jgi:lysozyme
VVNISPQGIAFIERNEGYAAHVYDDNGKPAIGYGHDLLPGESFPDGVTQAQAQDLLLRDLTLPQIALETLVPEFCTQNQWDALCDFAYNLGVGALKTMLAHGWEQVPEQMLRWQYEDVNGVQTVNAGLAARRQAEASLFKS